MKNTIPSLSSDAKPREKLLSYGANTLSNEELIAILLGSGSFEYNVVDLSRLVLKQFDNQFSLLARASFSELTKVKGIGQAKAVGLLAAFEIARRKDKESISCSKITCSEDVYKHFKFLQDIGYEEFWVCFLSRSNQIIRKHKISQGGVAGTVVDVKLIAKEAISYLASSVILVHNHPSGNLSPSQSDKHLTDKVKNGLNLLEIQVLDHIIIAGKSYTSFADEGWV